MIDVNIIKKDLFDALNSIKEKLYISAPGDKDYDDNIMFEGKLFKYILGWKITKKPGWHAHGGDYLTPPTYDIYGDFDFEFDYFDISDKEDRTIADGLKILSDRELDEIKKMFDYNADDWADEEYEFEEPDWDAEYKERKMMGELEEQRTIKINENDIISMVKRAINEVASKRTAINRIYKVTNELRSKSYRNDDYWNGPRMIVDAIKSLGYEVGLGAKDGGYRKSRDGMSQWKEYQIDIDTPEGFNIQGTLNCNAAGSIEDPFDRYDMTLVLW